jgi:Putative peptidoglycan binding domain
VSPTLRTPLQSVAHFRRYNRCEPGQCLAYVSRALGGPFGWDGLNEAKNAHRHAEKLHHGTHPPAGVPVYILGSRHGHVTLSVGAGKVRSTDWPHRGVVSEVGIMTLAKAWGREYAGWSEDLVGRKIPGVRLHNSSSSTYPGFQVHRGSQGAVVKTVQRRLIQHGFPLPINGHFGPRTQDAVEAFQMQNHLKVDGWVGRSTWAALWRG